MEARVSQALVRALADVLRQRGVEVEALLGDAAGSLAEPDDARVPLRTFQALITRAIELTTDPALGLHCGFLASAPSFGLMSPLVGHAASLREATALTAQFHGLLLEGVRVELTEQAGTARLCCKRFVPLDRSVVELVVAGLVRMLRAFGCMRSEIQSVCFEHKRPAYHHAYTALFRGAERFAQPFTGIEFSTRALDRTHVHWHPELQALLRTHAEHAVSRASKPQTCAERVHALLRTRARDVPDMEFVARELGISVSSLRRRLKEERTSFRALRESLDASID